MLTLDTITENGNGEGAGKRKNNYDFPRLSEDPCRYLSKC